MVWSFVYLAVRKVLALIVLVGRSDRSKELEILVLRHELAVGDRACRVRRPRRGGLHPDAVCPRRAHDCWATHEGAG
jgi:hypothetical protein